MKQSSLIEAKSTPCLCWLPFSWLKTLTVGNYSAGEQQSLKLMCNHRLEPDIKLNLAIFGSHKHPCINTCCAHCISAASPHNSVVHLCFCYRQKKAVFLTVKDSNHSHSIQLMQSRSKQMSKLFLKANSCCKHYSFLFILKYMNHAAEGSVCRSTSSRALNYLK